MIVKGLFTRGQERH